jgi:hypothetical protein
MTTTLGFKTISIENWSQPDPVMNHFVNLSTDGQTAPMTAEDWILPLMEPQLTHNTPAEIRRLYEVARGAAVYGILFYPLYTICAEQLTRVAEAAIKHRSASIPGCKTTMSFDGRIKLLRSVGVIDQNDSDRWDCLRQMRNSACHLEDQSILMPGDAKDLIGLLAEQINRLFP